MAKSASGRKSRTKILLAIAASKLGATAMASLYFAKAPCASPHAAMQLPISDSAAWSFGILSRICWASSAARAE